MPWHTNTALQVLESQHVKAETGLSQDEAASRLTNHGHNILKQQEGPGPWRIFWQQFTSPLVLILILAAAISLVLWFLESSKEEAWPYDTIVIMVIVVLNSLLGFIQEYRAEKSLQALKAMTAPKSFVRRDGKRQEIASETVVPGDILFLEAGNRVPADARLISPQVIELEESALTGESTTVRKQKAALEDPKTDLAERSNMVYMGTSVTFGHGEAVVVATGSETEMGRIATMLEQVEDDDTPLQKELARIGRQLGYLVLAISVIVFVVGLVQDGSFAKDHLISIFLFSVALAVAAIPEGLPAVVTVVLSLGVRRMARQHAIVRRLPAVETLGSADTICSDKTGTLTLNQMTVRQILIGSAKIIKVQGEGYDPVGTFSAADSDAANTNPPSQELQHLLKLAALNADASLKSPDHETQAWSIDGDPTEGALVVAARKAGLNEDSLRRSCPRLGEISFSSERKRMTTVHELDGQLTAIVKGAPDVILSLCSHIRIDSQIRTFDAQLRQQVETHNETFASEALRTLALASRHISKEQNQSDDECVLETDLVFEGLVGMIDPPREEAKQALYEAKKAGIRTLMITGDHPTTALAIARQLGMAEDGCEVLTGKQLSELSDKDFSRKVLEINVYARINPEQKLKIVRALKSHGKIVAMTGDGVNDAPALKEADIGIAMGQTGTDVSKEAADIILTNDNYATIVHAIAEGRNIFENIRKFVRYLLTSNTGEVLTIFVAIMAASLLGFTSNATPGFFTPLLAVQILWINLVTDGAPAMALGIDRSAENLMNRPPRLASEPQINRSMWIMIGVIGVMMMIGTLLVLDAYLPGGLVTLSHIQGSREENLPYARTAAFTTLVLFQMLNVFNCRSASRSVFHKDSFSNIWLLGAIVLSLGLHALVIYAPPLQQAFSTTSLTLLDWAITGTAALSVIAAGEVLKLFFRHHQP